MCVLPDDAYAAYPQRRPGRRRARGVLQVQIATKDSQIGILLDQLREANARLALPASQLAPLLEAVERSGDPHHPQLDRCHWNGQVGTRSIHSETWVRPSATTELLIADAPKGNPNGALAQA